MQKIPEVGRALDALGSPEAVNTDRQFNKASEKDAHDRAYTKILDAYSQSVSTNLKRKNMFKAVFFWIACSLLLLVFAGFAALVVYMLRVETSVGELCSVLVPAAVSFLTVFIVIPKIVAEYLFNADEEKYMSEIIKNVQSYDNAVQGE